MTLNWSASPNANYYTVYRSTLVDTLGGASNTLNTIVLNNNITGTSYTDTSPTDGSIYSYFVTATSAGGTSGNSASVVGVPLPAPPANAPAGLTAGIVQSTNITLNWSAVSGAVGYVIRRGASASGPFNYLMSITETTYTDVGLGANTTNYYQVLAVNAGGVSANSTVTVTIPPPAPASLGATPGNAQIVLNWAAASGATSYTLERGPSSGSETNYVTGLTGTSYTDTGLVNGNTYYYIVVAVGPGGTSGNSPEAHATPSLAAAPALLWKGGASGASTTWDTTTLNWLNGATATAYADGDVVFFDDTATTKTVATASGVYPGSVTFSNATSSYTVTGGGTGISGNTSLVKYNGGTLTLAGTHSYTNGTTVNGGSLVFSVAGAIPATGTLTLNNSGSVTVTPANSLPKVLVNGTYTITGSGNSGTGIATLDDEGTLTLAISSGSSKVFDLTGTMTGGGTLILGSSSMTLRFNGTPGDGNAIFNLGTGTATANVRQTSATAIALGGLAGGSGTQLQGDNSSGGANMTYTIGGAGANTEFDGRYCEWKHRHGRPHQDRSRSAHARRGEHLQRWDHDQQRHVASGQRRNDWHVKPQQCGEQRDVGLQPVGCNHQRLRDQWWGQFGAIGRGRLDADRREHLQRGHHDQQRDVAGGQWWHNRHAGSQQCGGLWDVVVQPLGCG